MATVPHTDSITVTEAAAELGISPQRVRVLIGEGRLPAEKVNPRMYLVRRRDLKMVMDRKTGRPKSDG